MNPLRITLIGGPTALIEIDGFRILTDPTFDAPGGLSIAACEAGKTVRPGA
jgi:L-ascorbate metabolism protein UlaG (beta-lactamase superfamily)